MNTNTMNFKNNLLQVGCSMALHLLCYYLHLKHMEWSKLEWDDIIESASWIDWVSFSYRYSQSMLPNVL